MIHVSLNPSSHPLADAYINADLRNETVRAAIKAASYRVAFEASKTRMIRAKHRGDALHYPSYWEDNRRFEAAMATANAELNSAIIRLADEIVATQGD